MKTRARVKAKLIGNPSQHESVGAALGGCFNRQHALIAEGSAAIAKSTVELITES